MIGYKIKIIINLKDSEAYLLKNYTFFVLRLKYIDFQLTNEMLQIRKICFIPLIICFSFLKCIIISKCKYM